MQFFNTKTQYKKIKKEIDSAIIKILKSGIFIGGKEIDKFEKAITKVCGTKYAISVNSGTDAIFLSLKALNIGVGDEVITSPFTFVATAEAIANAGAKPVFVDIEAETFNIDAKKIEEKITKKTKAILPVHLFGQMANMREIIKIAKKYKLSIIEDAAQAIGAEDNSKKAGSLGDCGCFSFFPTKNLGACGDGGIITTNNKEIAQKLNFLKNHGSSTKEKYLNLFLGFNSRLDAIQASILNVKLKYFKEWNKKRLKNAEYYNKELSKIKQIITPIIFPKKIHIFNQYTIRVVGNDRKILLNYLADENIPIMIYYNIPIHLQPAFKFLGLKQGDFPIAEKTANEVVSLPIYPELSRKQQDVIIKKIKNFYKIKN